MKSTTDDNFWESVHLYYPGGVYSTHADEILRNTCASWRLAVDQIVGNDLSFAVRYDQAGSHIRWRTRTRASRKAELRKLLETLADEWVSSEAGRRAEWVAYEPEQSRYGGHRAMPIAEGVFHVSTTLAIALAQQGRLEHAQSRLGMGLAAMLGAFHRATPSMYGIANLAQRYSIGYLNVLAMDTSERESLHSRFDSAWERQRANTAQLVTGVTDSLLCGDSLSAEFDDYFAGIKNYMHELAGILDIANPTSPSGELAAQAAPMLFSQVHMTSNRLGIPIVEETFLAHVVFSTLNRG